MKVRLARFQKPAASAAERFRGILCVSLSVFLFVGPWPVDRVWTNIVYANPRTSVAPGEVPVALVSENQSFHDSHAADTIPSGVDFFDSNPLSAVDPDQMYSSNNQHHLQDREVPSQTPPESVLVPKQAATHLIHAGCADCDTFDSDVRSKR